MGDLQRLAQVLRVRDAGVIEISEGPKPLRNLPAPRSIASSGLTLLDLQPFELNLVRMVAPPPPNRRTASFIACRKLSTFHIGPISLIRFHEKQNVRHR
jgi:hypothetical protein